MAVAAVSFLLSLASRDITAATVLAATALSLVAAAGSSFRHRMQVRADLAEARDRWLASPRVPGHPWTLAALSLVCGACTVHLLHHALLDPPDCLHAGDR